MKKYPDWQLQTPQAQGAALNWTDGLNQKDIKLILTNTHCFKVVWFRGLSDIHQSWNWFNLFTQAIKSYHIKGKTSNVSNQWRKGISSNSSLLQKWERDSHLNWQIIFLLKPCRTVQIMDRLAMNCFLKTFCGAWHVKEEVLLVFDEHKTYKDTRRQ